MRILHTSDWHLGRTLHKESLAEAQRDAMRQIQHIATEEDVDLVVVSGDVFDHTMPPAEALEILEASLVELLKVAPVVLTAGNHDSRRRLGYGAKLFNEKLHVHTDVKEVGAGIDFTDEHGTVRVYPIPYLHPETARKEFAGDEELPATHEAVVGEAMTRIRSDLAGHPQARSVVLAHAWVAGGAVSDSERDVTIGGVATVSSDVFTGIDYVALGHLHGPQEPKSPDGRTRLRYSGSPLRYSFSEATHEKSVTIVDLGAHGVEQIRTVPIDQPRDMAVLSGTIEDLLDPAQHTDHLDSWVSVSVTDDARPTQMWARIKERFPYALQVNHVPASGFVKDSAQRDIKTLTPLQVAAEFVLHVTNGPISEGEEKAFDSALQSVEGAGQ